jgi:hypothetical protein
MRAAAFVMRMRMLLIFETLRRASPARTPRSKMNRIVLAALIAATLPAVAAADQRSYAFTYQPVTAPKGALDLELYTTFHEAGVEGAPDFWRYQAELEYGVTDRFDVSLYNVFRKVSGADVEYEAVKGRTRYRITEPGAWVVDAVAYLEVEQSFLDEKATALEEKIILGKDLGRLNLALNLVAEQELEDGAFETEWGYGFGSSYELTPAFRVGAETFGDLKEVYAADGSESMELAAWVGPSVSVALPAKAGVLHGAWLAMTAGVGLTDSSDDVRLRAILAFQF